MTFVIQNEILGKLEKLYPNLVLGFMLLAAYNIATILKKFRLPLITGYIAAGLFLGPFFLNFYTSKNISDLTFLNSLALAYIAFCAGGELRYKRLINKLRSITIQITGVTLFVFIGVTITVFCLSHYFTFMSSFTAGTRLAISSLFGVIAVARSPSSTIAIISETKAKGDYTETVLSASVATDVIIIIFFAITVSFSEIFITGKEGSVDLLFFFALIFEIVIAFILGFILGKGIIFLIRRVHVEFPVVIVAMGFLVIKFCHYLSEYLDEIHAISINLEPLLICMAAGYTIQNFSKYGEDFLIKMDKVSAPIYVAFFTITGASINLEILRTGWILGLIVFFVRGTMIFLGSYLSGRLLGDTEIIYKYSWLGFITQAGVSLGLLSEVVRRFPEIGIPIQSILIASITINQIIGPILFKYGLGRAGETNIKRA